MSRKTTTLFWLCLLSLFPLLSAAQTLARFDYWIDDNIGDMQTKSLSGTSAEIIEELDLSRRRGAGPVGTRDGRA